MRASLNCPSCRTLGASKRDVHQPIRAAGRLLPFVFVSMNGCLWGIDASGPFGTSVNVVVDAADTEIRVLVLR